jgi:hypothetical protein
VKNSANSFTLTYKNVPYNLTIKLNEKSLSLKFKRQYSPNCFEGLFTYEQFSAMNKFFLFFKDLNKIKEFILNKITQENFSLIEENDCLFFVTNINFENVSEEIKIKIAVNKEVDMNSHIDDICKTMINFSEKLKKVDALLSELIEKKKTKKELKRSKILKPEEIKLITSWIGHECKFKLLFRASKHGNSALDFHRKCDNRGKTITFIECTQGNRFGGYSEQPWDQSGGVKTDSNAFIFSLNKNKKLSIKSGYYSIHCNSSYGPIFGYNSNGNYDLVVSPNSAYQSYSNLRYSYGQNEGVTGYFLTGANNFTPKEIEVYRVR